MRPERFNFIRLNLGRRYGKSRTENGYDEIPGKNRSLHSPGDIRRNPDMRNPYGYPIGLSGGESNVQRA